MHKIKLLFLFLVLGLVSMTADKPAYFIFNGKGQHKDYNDILKDALKSDIVFFGEQHNNPICHWLQLELTTDLFRLKGPDVMLGAEMFESDNQLILNEYINNKIKPKNFEAEAKLWPNYNTDYKPLVEFARTNGCPFIATNIPRRYAAMVNKGGFAILDSLPLEAKSLIAPLPVLFDPELKSYKEMLTMELGPGVENNINVVQAQAIKDATMAHFILKNYTKGKLFLHFNGTFHTEHYEGIVWYLKNAQPDLKILTIATLEQDTITVMDEKSKGLADYLLVVPSNMTKTR